MLKVVTVVGARPQFVKVATLTRAFSEFDNVQHIVIHTGQHFDSNMSEIFFNQLNIPLPQYNLSISSLSHGAMTGRMIEKIEEVLLIEKPHILVVFGDTNSTLAGALAAVKHHIPIAHVEAGLRSFNMDMPEEINRILTDRISNILFCPTSNSVKNLQNEGFTHFGVTIVDSGDVMKDASMYYKQFSLKESLILDNLNLSQQNYLLCTLHRAENIDNLQRIRNILSGLNILAEVNPIVIPVHPRAKTVFEKFNLHPNIVLIEPCGYLDMITLISNCRLVVTDSGGLQKEAYFFNKFCVTVRDQTEWVELVDHGYNKLVGDSTDSLLTAVDHFQSLSFSNHTVLYGDGKASYKIVNTILRNI